MVFSILSEMKKGNNKTNFEKKEYKSANEWIDKPTCSACIEELKEHFEDLHKEFDKLKTKVNFLFIKYSFLKCSSKLIDY